MPLLQPPPTGNVSRVRAGRWGPGGGVVPEFVWKCVPHTEMGRFLIPRASAQNGSISGDNTPRAFTGTVGFFCNNTEKVSGQCQTYQQLRLERKISLLALRYSMLSHHFWSGCFFMLVKTNKNTDRQLNKPRINLPNT